MLNPLKLSRLVGHHRIIRQAEVELIAALLPFHHLTGEITKLTKRFIL